MFHTIGFILFAGYLSAYGYWPTVRTVEYYQELDMLPSDVSGYDALVAVPNCDLIGHEGIMTIESQDRMWHGPIEGGEFTVLVFDCGGAGDGIGHDWMIQNSIVGEVDYMFWKEHPEFVGGGVEVLIEIER